MGASEIRLMKSLGATALGSGLFMLSAQFAAAQVAGVSTTSASQGAPAGNSEDGTGNEVVIVVTANHRVQSVTDIPYNISAVGAEQLRRTGVNSVEELAGQVPNLSINTTSAASLGAQRPIIRGLNASASERAGQAFEQSPVAIYLGNSPSGGFFPVDDVERVEVLRGPQGTLYGAGALGGTLRVIPNDPKIGVFEGQVSGSVGMLAHSDDLDYSVSGVLNIPLAENLAFRVAGRYRRDAGFIDNLGVLETTGTLAGPTLADPSDIAGSPGIRTEVKDVNDNELTNVRASLKWDGGDGLNIVAAYNFSRFTGDATNSDTPSFAGGADPIDPRVTLPATGEYETASRLRQPYSRNSHMGSLDVSYDAGFATFASTTSYYHTKGDRFTDNTYATFNLIPAFRVYYTGDPINPRFVMTSNYADRSNAFTQEFRVVSNGTNQFDYVAGLYYQKEKRHDIWNIYIPGTAEQTAATPGGVDVLTFGPQGQSGLLDNSFTFEDKAIFGELTWHPTKSWQITGGARYFIQDLNRTLYNQIYAFGLFVESSQKSRFKDAIFKLNSSYEFTRNHKLYGTFSQGFRRGGANAVPTVGLFGEVPERVIYEPDKVDNYEVGVKGKFDNGITYSANLYLVNWDKPQIGLLTPITFWSVVANVSKARSKGFEMELSGPIGGGFSFSAGYAYADAKLAEDFCLTFGAGDPTGGSNVIPVPCALSGQKGARMPGSPKHSGSFNLSYDREIGDKQLNVSVNANYKGGVIVALPTILIPEPAKVSGFWMVNAQASVQSGPWNLGLYVKNLFDERGVVSRNIREVGLGGLELGEVVSRPRSVGLRVTYGF